MPLKVALKLFEDRLSDRKRFLDDVTSEDELRGGGFEKGAEKIVCDD
jgi:hypothetical protein